MKKYLFSFLLVVLYQLNVIGQATATEGKVEYQKGDKIAAMIEVPYPPDVVEDAIKNYMSQKGIKGDKSKGFTIFRGARLSESDLEMSDLHFKVERKGRREKEASVVYLLVGRPSENVGVRTSDDRHKVHEGIMFLNEMVPTMDARNLEAEIARQEEEVKKAEKRLKNLEDDQQDLERKIKNLEEKLEENRNDQKRQVDEVNKQRIALEAMKNRRRNS